MAISVYDTAEGQQLVLVSDQNEHLVVTKRQQLPRVGIFTVPIHMDVQAHTHHKQSQLHPILDFQLLFGLPTITSRYKYLEVLVSREK